MSLFSSAWSLKRLLPRKAARRPKSRTAVQLRLEHLEDRTVLSTFTVNPNVGMGDFTTIQAAINAAASGDTILVAPGTYQEHVTIGKSLTLKGAQAGVPGFNHTGAESVIDGTSNGGAVAISANNIILDGFTITNGSTGAAAGVSIPGNVSGITVEDNIITNNQIGINANGANVTIQANLIENNNVGYNVLASGGSGIYSDQGTSGMVITNNHFQNNLNGPLTFAQLTSPLRNLNLMVTNNVANDVNFGSFADVTNGVIDGNTINATNQFYNITIDGGVNGLVISNNTLNGGTHGVGVFTDQDPVANKGVVISPHNVFSGHSVSAITVDHLAESDTINATNNFYGSPTGPHEVPRNPNGTGEAIIDPDQNVLFTPFAFNAQFTGDLVLSGNNLVVSRTTGGNVGDVTYVLDGNPPVVLTGVTTIAFNGQPGNDSMTVQTANGVPLVAGSIIFYGNSGTNTITVDAAGQHEVSLMPGGHYIVESLPLPGAAAPVVFQQIYFNNVQTTNINNAVEVQTIAGPDTADRPTAFTGLTAQERFVQAVYLDELGRAGSKAELDSWVAVLNAPGGSQSVVAADIQHSQEARDHLVKSWYVTFLGRQADGTEEQVWVNLLPGQTEEQVLSQILASAEFNNRAQALVTSGSANERFVQALYLLLLNRTGDAGGLASFANAAPQAAAQGIMNSTEFRGDLFEGYYEALLHRPSDSMGLNNHVSSNQDAASVRIAIEGSPEFFTNG